MAQSTTIRWAAWYGDLDLEIPLPEEWRVETYRMRGGADIGEAGIRRAFAEPIGTPTIAELARGKRSCCVVVDDLSRPTPAEQLIPVLLEELERGGIARAEIQFIMGIAAHRPMTREDCIKKLGEAVVEEFHVANHHPYENLVDLGRTKFNTPVLVNADFAAADLKICVGSICPHSGPGFGGGAKLVLPGVAGIESLYNMHRPDTPPRGQLAVVDSNEMRADMEEFARMAGLNAIANVVVNERREIAGCVAGDFVEAHREGVKMARQVYATPIPVGVDVGIFNTYPKDVELIQSGMAFNVWSTAKEPIVYEGGTVVLCCACTEGAGYHSLFGPKMRLGGAGGGSKRPFGDRRFVIFSPGINRWDLPERYREGATLCKTWDGVVAELKRHHGEGTRVAVFPCSAIQIAEN